MQGFHNQNSANIPISTVGRIMEAKSAGVATREETRSALTPFLRHDCCVFKKKVELSLYR
jgi:hypothetical protein